MEEENKSNGRNGSRSSSRSKDLYAKSHRDERRGGDRHVRRRGESREGGYRGGRRDFKMPSLSGPLLPYKVFIEKQGLLSIDRSEQQALYDDYKSEYEKKQAEYFFEEHQNDCWMKEKYDPELSFKWQQEKQAQSRVIADKFVEFFVERTSDSQSHGLCLDQDPSRNYD